MAQFNIQDYDRYIVSFSGGKDSTATFLYLLDHGIPREKIELWHQDIDGRERNLFRLGSDARLLPAVRPCLRG